MMVFSDLICLRPNLVSFLVFFPTFSINIFPGCASFIRINNSAWVCFWTKPSFYKCFFWMVTIKPLLSSRYFLGFQPMTPQSFASFGVPMDIQKLICVLNGQTWNRVWWVEGTSPLSTFYPVNRRLKRTSIWWNRN